MPDVYNYTTLRQRCGDILEVVKAFETCFSLSFLCNEQLGDFLNYCTINFFENLRSVEPQLEWQAKRVQEFTTWT